MQKHISIIALITILSFLSSCSKDDDFDYSQIKTEGELIGEELKTVVNTNGITEASTYLKTNNSYGVWFYTLFDYREEFKIEGQFISLGGNFYNLNKLTRYEIVTISNEKILNLHFDGYN